MSKPTGTAVTTINDCRAPIPPAPMKIRAAATAPIAISQNALIHLGGSSTPVTATAMENAIQEPVVTRKRRTRTRATDIINWLKGNWLIMAMSGAGR